MEKRVSIEDVAAAAGVSIMSVSRAMRDVEGISQEKREQILNLARSLGYYPNRVAVSLAASSSNLIGVSVPTLFGTVFSEIYDGMRANFERNGFATMIDVSDYSLTHEEAWVERMISWRPAGLILSGVDHSELTRDRLTKSNIPVVEVWDYTDTPIDLCVGIDHFQSGVEMGDYLTSLNYQRPAYVGVKSGVDPRAERRLAGLRQSFEKQGTQFCAVERSAPDATFESGFLATKRLLSALDSKPDVICFLNDNMAFGGLMACEGAGMSCPAQIGIVGYNGLNINEVLPKRITTSITPRRKIGEIAAQVLIAKILGAATQPATKLKVIIEKGETTKLQGIG
ncbi:MAG: LacI family DNA-binding transcriptional regulator [Ahrensia sp.]|nr:LacI family DNA-binding transcriptional regulator [Ahrensia sp.]